MTGWGRGHTRFRGRGRHWARNMNQHPGPGEKGGSREERGLLAVFRWQGVFKIIMIISFSEAHKATKFDTRTFVRDRSEVFGYEGKV